MNFGNTIEEQYAKISAINILMKKFVKTTKTIFISLAIAVSLFFVVISGEISLALIFGVILFGINFLAGSFLGRTYCWAWILFCEKYNPKHLASSFAKALDNSAVYGYVYGGSSGAKQASIGTAVVMLVFAAFYLNKGQIYSIKYKNLPQRELELKKQLDAKYGKTV